MATVDAGLGFVSPVASGGVAHFLDTTTNYTAGKLQSWRNNGSEKASITYEGGLTLSGDISLSDGLRQITMDSADNGTGVGPHVTINRNNNASTPAAGYVNLYDNGNFRRSIWPDSSGNLRIHTFEPTNANDTAGTVVGTQTSDAKHKKNVRPWTPEGALAAILELRSQLKSFRYKSNSLYGDRVLHGLVIEKEDRGAWWTANTDHEDGVAVLNEIALWGRMIAATGELADRLKALEVARG